MQSIVRSFAKQATTRNYLLSNTKTLTAAPKFNFAAGTISFGFTNMLLIRQRDQVRNRS